MTAKPVRPYEPAGIALFAAAALLVAVWLVAVGWGIAGLIFAVDGVGTACLFLPWSIRDYRQRRDTARGEDR